MDAREALIVYFGYDSYISPLISLMQDQVKALPLTGLHLIVKGTDRMESERRNLAVQFMLLFDKFMRYSLQQPFFSCNLRGRRQKMLILQMKG